MFDLVIEIQRQIGRLGVGAKRINGGMCNTGKVGLVAFIEGHLQLSDRHPEQAHQRIDQHLEGDESAGMPALGVAQ